MVEKTLLVGLIIIALTIFMIGCVPTNRPDLMVQDIDIPDVDCVLVAAGVTCTTTVTFTIANIGTADAGPFKVLVEADPGLAQTQTVSVAGLAAGATTTLTVALPPSGNCYDPDCSVCVTVDSDSEVTESNEGNNQKCELTMG